MPLSPAAQKQVDEWLRYAHSDLALARADVPEVLPELLCFHAQQAAEKALKALFIGLGLPFPLVHHLGRLLDLLEDRGEKRSLPKCAPQTR
jgi:HEPN domain-containing protein